MADKSTNYDPKFVDAELFYNDPNALDPRKSNPEYLGRRSRERKRRRDARNANPPTAADIAAEQKLQDALGPNEPKSRAHDQMMADDSNRRNDSTEEAFLSSLDGNGGGYRGGGGGGGGKNLSDAEIERLSVGEEALRRGVSHQVVLDERRGILRPPPKSEGHEPIYYTDPETGERTVATPEQAGIQKLGMNRRVAEDLQGEREERRRLILIRIDLVRKKLAKAKTIESKKRIGKTLEKLLAGLAETEQTDKEREDAAVTREDARYLRREETLRELARRSISRRINRGADPSIIDRYNEGAKGRGIDRFIDPSEVGLRRRALEDGEIIDAEDGPRMVRANEAGERVEVPVQERDGEYALDASTMTPSDFQTYYTSQDARTFRVAVYDHGGAFASRQRRIDSGRMALLEDNLDEDARAEGEAMLDEEESKLHYEFSKRIGSKRPVVKASTKKGKGDEPEMISNADILEELNEHREANGDEPLADHRHATAKDQRAARKRIEQRRADENTEFDATGLTDSPGVDEVGASAIPTAMFDSAVISMFNRFHPDKSFSSIAELTQECRDNPSALDVIAKICQEVTKNDWHQGQTLFDRIIPKEMRSNS